MRKNAIKKLGFGIFVLLIALVLLSVVPMSRTIFAAEDDKAVKCFEDYEKKYEKEKEADKIEIDDIDAFVEEYHAALNCYMNKRIEDFVGAKKEERENMDYVPFKIIDQNGEKIRKADPEECDKIKNATSTYCVSQKFLKEYYKFRERMLTLRNQGLIKAQQKATKEQSEKKKEISDIVKGYDEILEATRGIDNQIDDELGYAEKTMEMALSAYNELHMAYPLHEKLKTFTFELENFRDALADIRDEVELLPFTFFNVQTSSCK